MQKNLAINLKILSINENLFIKRKFHFYNNSFKILDYWNEKYRGASRLFFHPKVNIEINSKNIIFSNNSQKWEILFSEGTKINSFLYKYSEIYGQFDIASGLSFHNKKNHHSLIFNNLFT